MRWEILQDRGQLVKQSYFPEGHVFQINGSNQVCSICSSASIAHSNRSSVISHQNFKWHKAFNPLTNQKGDNIIGAKTHQVPDERALREVNLPNQSSSVYLHFLKKATEGLISFCRVASTTLVSLYSLDQYGQHIICHLFNPLPILFIYPTMNNLSFQSTHFNQPLKYHL